jgi:hypothetical protein
MALRSYRAITHIHSSGSNAQASPGSGVINALVRDQFGETMAAVVWTECDTSVSDLEAILAGSRTSQPVDLLFLTDHLSPDHHAIDEAVFDLARRCRRFGVGAEIQTCLPASGGTWSPGHDVLLYGPAGLQPGPGGGYYGLTQAFVDEAFEACTPPGAPMPETLRLREFCRRRGAACALAHPLDGHALTVRQVLTVMAAFDFVETLNGGYSDANARALERLCAMLRERQRAGQAGGEALTAPGAVGEHPPALIALGGADAHLKDFDRVVTLFRHDGGPPDAGDFLAAMLRARTDPGAARLLFTPAGRGMRTDRLIVEIMAIGLRNLARNRHLLGGRSGEVSVVLSGFRLAVSEVMRKRRAAKDQRAQVAEWLQGRGDPGPLVQEAADSAGQPC